MTSPASNCVSAATLQGNRFELRTASQNEPRVHFIKLTKALLSLPLDNSYFTLIHVARRFQESLVQSRRTTPSRLPTILTACRSGEVDESTPEAKFYKQGGSRAVDTFCAAVREVPLDGRSANEVDREACIRRHGGRHAVQAFHAIDTLYEDGDIDNAKALIQDYGGTQALAIYAAAKTSSPEIAGLIEDLSEDSISVLLDCISEVNPHRDLAYIIERLVRTRRNPQWKAKRTYIGRAPRGGRGEVGQQKHDLSELRRPRNRRPPKHITQNLSNHADLAKVTQPVVWNTKKPTNMEIPQSDQYNSQPPAEVRDMARDEAPQVDLLPAHESGQDLVAPFVDFLETDLSVFLQPDFHFSLNN